MLVLILEALVVHLAEGSAFAFFRVVSTLVAVVWAVVAMDSYPVPLLARPPARWCSLFAPALPGA